VIRIGHGFDVHKLVAGEYLILGGVKIPHNRTLEAHSDGDVVLHALMDALLGAAALGDIGQHFPDSAEDYKNIDSRVLLREVSKKIDAQGYSVGNIDLTIVAQAPKMAPHIGQMKDNISNDVHCAVDAVNLKATTTEGLGYVGREEGIAVHAVVTIRHNQGQT